MKNYIFHVIQVMAIAIFIIFLVEWLSEGNVDLFLQNPIGFFISLLIISLLGGFLIYRIQKRMSSNTLKEWQEVELSNFNPSLKDQLRRSTQPNIFKTSAIRLESHF